MQQTLPSSAQAEALKVVETIYSPMRILEIELNECLPSLLSVDVKTGNRYNRAMCLMRLHRQPLGFIELPLSGDETPPASYIQSIWDALGGQINAHLLRDNLPPVTSLEASGIPTPDQPACREERERFLADAPFVSVIVPTHNRPDRAIQCLKTLLALDYPRYEIIMVDNAPRNSETADLIAQTYQHEERVRYIREDRIGASHARNSGVVAARGEILAFADDDIVVDRDWLLELAYAFKATSDVACVTGLLLPLELETAPQFWIEEFGGFSKGFNQKIFDLREYHPGTPLHPFAAGQFGTGANMAFTTDFMREAGGFDIALGPGKIARGGEDLTLFFQAVIRGHRLVYQPSAISYHPHHREYAALREQIYSYGIGLAAYLMRNIVTHPRLLLDFALKVPYGLYFTLNDRSSKNSKKSLHYPKELTRLEQKGLLYGPLAYLRSRWNVRQMRNASASGR
ncbi:MAG TPA: glycosyltransferase [Ktedonobacteraceae bacterium]|nr:glycosyltransferase [Ktedonobacteraceae bacterium]